MGLELICTENIQFPEGKKMKGKIGHGKNY